MAIKFNPLTGNFDLSSIWAYGQSNVSSASPVALTSATPTNITNLSLGPGDWDIDGVVNFSTTGASSSDFKAGVSQSSGAFGADNTWSNIPLIATALSDVLSNVIPAQRIVLTSTTTIYLVAQATFSLGSISGYGLLRARKVG